MNKKSNLPYRQVLMDGIQDMVFIMRVADNDHFYIEFLNRAAIEKTGLDERILGKRLTEVFPEEEANFLLDHCKRAARSLECPAYENSLLSPSGERLYFKSRVTALFAEADHCSHVMAVFHDITEEKSLFTELQHNGHRFRFIAENIHDLITVLDWQGKIIYASPSYKNALGFSPEEYEGKLFFQHVHPDDANILKKTMTECSQTGKSCKLECRQRHKTKGWVWAELRGTPVFDDNSKFIHTVIVSRDISLQKQHIAQLQQMAYHDALTELPNRRLFKKYFKKILKNFVEKKEKFTVIMMDIDNFKSINDEWGHDTGDAVIAEFGKRIRQTIRDTDMVARFGGDEFIILLPGIGTEDMLLPIVHRLQKAIEKPWEIDSNELEVTTSIGITMANNLFVNYRESELITTADDALYEAKEAGKNMYKIKPVNKL